VNHYVLQSSFHNLLDVIKIDPVFSIAQLFKLFAQVPSWSRIGRRYDVQSQSEKELGVLELNWSEPVSVRPVISRTPDLGVVQSRTKEERREPPAFVPTGLSPKGKEHESPKEKGSEQKEAFTDEEEKVFVLSCFSLVPSP
jgi:hypothetical protein